MRASLLTLALFASLLAGCSCADSHERDVDAGPLVDARVGADAPVSCMGSPPPFQCTVCGSDSFTSPACMPGGSWQCPIGMTPAPLCPAGCLGPAPGPDCSCDTSGASPRWSCPCNAATRDGTPCTTEGESCGACCPVATEPTFGPFLCSGGRWLIEPCPFDCPVPDPTPCPARPVLGATCPVEGQECGDPCCDTAVLCEGGVWAPGPVADCAICSSYGCGPAGSCRADQACASFGCPGDETCQPLPVGCSSCDCVAVPPGARCEVRDGHVFLSGGDCA
ncbi:MAG: hypothetical protein K1X94_07305 [Sandaracinaceae bacterium]|nr:hypothetical protein [Sandaracinaceae bacterium]